MVLDQNAEEVKIITRYHDAFLIKSGIKNNENRGFLKFHPSSFGECFRKMALQYYGETDSRLKEKNKVEPRSQRIFASGHAFHNRIQMEFALMGILLGYWQCRCCGKIHGTDSKIGIHIPDTCECLSKNTEENRRGLDLFEYREIALGSEEYNFGGHCDGVIEIAEGGSNDGLYVIDFKSINSERFSLLKSPETKYINQINIYMWLLGLDKGIIYYEDKNEHRTKEFLVCKSESRVDEIKNNSKKLFDLLKKRGLPKIPSHFERESKPCKYCGYLDFCWGDKGETK